VYTPLGSLGGIMLARRVDSHVPRIADAFTASDGYNSSVSIPNVRIERVLEVARRLGIKSRALLEAAMRVRGVAAEDVTLPDLVAGLRALTARRKS